MASLVQALASRPAATRGVDVRLSAPADRLERAGDGWAVWSGGQAVEADAVVLATPAPATATLLRPHDDEAAGLLQAIDYASVVLVTFRVGADDVPSPLHGTGFLVPRRSPRKGREPWAVTACTFLDRKWPHLARDGEVLLRASLGRIDDTRAGGWSDEEVAERAWEELGALMGVDRRADGGGRGAPSPTPSRSTGCTTCCGRPGSRRPWPGSAAWPSPARRTTASGIPACIASGRAAAHALL